MAVQNKDLPRFSIVADRPYVKRILIAAALSWLLMALAWVLRGGRVTSALIGASRPSQVEDCVGALKNLEFSAAELAEIESETSHQTKTATAAAG